MRLLFVSVLRVASKIDRWQRYLIASDLHSYCLDKRAWTIFLGVASDGCEGRAWDCVILNGDTCDFASLARFDRSGGGVMKRSELGDDFTLEEEILCIQTDIFRPLRKAAAKAPIIFRNGNHEQRWERVTTSKPEALMSLLKTMKKRNSFYLPDILELQKYGIQYDEKETMKLHDCYTLTHGWRTNKTCAEYYLQRFGSGTSGHTHKASVAQKVLQGKLETWMESGCLCRIKDVSYLQYGAHPDWTQGYLTVVIDTKYKRAYPQFHAIDDAYRSRFNAIVYGS